MVLRAFERRHLEATLRWFNDPSLARLLDRARSITPEEHERWFRGLASRTDLRYFAIERIDDDSHIGNVWLANIDRRHATAEVRIVIGRSEAVGVGFGTEAIRQVTAVAFDALDLSKLHAQVLEHNLRAIRAFRKAGFLIEGRLVADRCIQGTYQDVVILGRCRPDRFAARLTRGRSSCQACDQDGHAAAPATPVSGT